MNKILWVADRSTGSFIEMVNSIQEGMDVIERFETEDKENGDYTPDFYCIVDEDHCLVV